MKNVYHVDRDLNKLSDGRVYPTYSTSQVILPVFFSFLLIEKDTVKKKKEAC